MSEVTVTTMLVILDVVSGSEVVFGGWDVVAGLDGVIGVAEERELELPVGAVVVVKPEVGGKLGLDEDEGRDVDEVGDWVSDTDETVDAETPNNMMSTWGM
jgi:hypothetical protein